MRKKLVSFGPYILLGLALLVLFVLNIFFQDHWLDSDMAAEMMFSRLLSEEHRIFATPDWYYSTEFRFLYTQLVMGPLFLIFDNWHVIRTITNLVFYGLVLLSYFYFMKPFRVSKGFAVLGGVVLLLPFSETMMTHMQMGNTYLSHVVICFFFFGMFLRLAGKKVQKRRQRLVLLLCYIGLAVICGVSGVRYLLALQCPLVIASLLYAVRSEKFRQFRREASGRELLSLQSWLRVGRMEEAHYFLYSLLGAVCSVAGYGMNVLWVSRRFVFQTYDATNFIPIYQGELFERLQNAIGCLLMFFGYIPEKGFLSLRGMISILSFLLTALCCFCMVRSLRKEKGERFFLGIFAVSAFLLNFFVFVFTTSTMVPRYYITIFIFVLPLFLVYGESREPAMDRAAVTILLAGSLFLGTCKTVLSFVMTDKNESRRPAAEFLAKEDLTFGFATYNNANIITELTNGEVEVANVWDPDHLEYFKWSTPKRYYEEGYHQGETFLLLTEEECTEYEEAEALQQGEIVYEDGAYKIFVYDSVEMLLKCGRKH